MARSDVVASAVTTFAILIAIQLPAAAATAQPARLGQLDFGLFPTLGALMSPAETSQYGQWVPLREWPSQARLVLSDWHSVSAGELKTPRHVPGVPAIERRDLLRGIHSRLPSFENLFRHAAKTHDLPASLLAAQAYIESKWNPSAHHRGVAGLMMLSRRTAQLEGVGNRLKASESVAGGAAYLARMRASIADDIPLPDRNYFALAAYNMGLAHVYDAQTLAKRLGKNPHVWGDVREVIPLLAEKRYYTTLPYGYARGASVVRYINRIRGYQAIIAPHIR